MRLAKEFGAPHHVISTSPLNSCGDSLHLVRSVNLRLPFCGRSLSVWDPFPSFSSCLFLRFMTDLPTELRHGTSPSRSFIAFLTLTTRTASTFSRRTDNPTWDSEPSMASMDREGGFSFLRIPEALGRSSVWETAFTLWRSQAF